MILYTGGLLKAGFFFTFCFFYAISVKENIMESYNGNSSANASWYKFRK